ncbi:hypothetical protein JB92DRAFT_3138677 [Gautieria morchelliformis]|nr:hypothetical protein JB92DRAFT_3138677 [Gautieria morchelliformis]
MLSFWGRISNKSPGRTSNLPSQSSPRSEDVELPRTSPRTAHLTHVPPTEGHAPTVPAQVAPEPVVAAVPNPHDAAVAEVHAKILQAEQESSTAHHPRFTDPLTDAATPPNPPPEKFFEPATGILRGIFEPVATGTPVDSEQLRDEAWAHLARIREIQSEIATMHMHMEGVGDETGSIDVDVDNDVDVDTVPTQEEEDAAKTAKEFDKLPGRFKGRSDNINAIMAKLDELSQAVTSFHALQPPPLSFDSPTTSRQTTHSDTTTPTDVSPTTVRTRTTFGSKAVLDKKPLHDSPLTTRAPFSPLADISSKS